MTLALAVACRENKQPQPFSVIPMPNDVTLAEGTFDVAGAAVTWDGNLDAASAKAVDGFVQTLQTVTGKSMKSKKRPIHFGLNPNLGAEEYFLQVKPDGVDVEASAFGGFFYAIQTLKQMLPAEVYGGKKAHAAWLLPCVTILDAPRFDYRGIHLDACRHFWTIEETKRYIDIAAAYKINRLHWHQTEDQGWRIEIKKYPKLTE
ncbi:MAG: family 20 glycosylhydrolase, partial [Bacteroidales bacterium]|nr:family 20 glycosylhydrolase [Bacteroidales bacterium]